MKIYKEESLANFEFWSGAKDTAQRIWEEKGSAGFDTIEQILEDMYPEEMDETEINDLFWFESETIYEWLGIPTDEQAEARMVEKGTEAARVAVEMANLVLAIDEMEPASEDE